MKPSVKNFVSGVLAFLFATSPIGLGKAGKPVGTDVNGVKTVYVSVDGVGAKADGTKSNPFGTIEAARDAIRSVDKNKYDEIDVVIGAGRYELDETIAFTAEDSGSAKCRVCYIGEDGAVLTGGAEFGAKDLQTAGGKTAEYLLDEVKDKVVMIDLTRYGLDPADIKDMTVRRSGGNNVFLCADGEQMTLARYPNDEFAYVKDGSYVNSAKGLEWAELNVDTMFVFMDRDNIYSMKYWHDLSSVYACARYSSMDYADAHEVFSYQLKGSMEVLFTRRVLPKAGMPFYWYNIPEELDAPGEYYIDENCVLYFYPTADSDGAVYSVPVLDADLISLDGCSYVTFEKLTLTGTRQSAITGSGNKISVTDCTISEAAVDGVRLTGSGNKVEGCDIFAIGETAVDLAGGDEMNIVRSGNVIAYNRIHDWAIGYGFETPAILVRGCGTTVAHNECTDSVCPAIDYGGPYHVIEYNYCDNTCRFSGNNGVIGSAEVFCNGTVIRYNHVTNSGFTRDLAIDDVGTQGIMLGGGQEGVTVYGNVVDDVTGAGISMFGGRNNEVYGNLTAKCRYGIHYDSCIILQAYNIDPIGCNRVGPSDDHVRSAKWKEEFPVLKTYTYYSYGMNYDEECLGTKDFNAAPVSKVYDNVYYLDRNVHERLDHPFYYDKYVEEYSGDDYELPTKNNGTLYYLSAKDPTYDIEKCVADNQKTLAITAAQFAEIGTGR